MHLSLQDYRILEILDVEGGWVTRQVAIQACGGAGRSESQIASRRLRALQAAKLVCPLDEHKPVAWCRTAAGTDALERAKSLGSFSPD